MGKDELNITSEKITTDVETANSETTEKKKRGRKKGTKNKISPSSTKQTTSAPTCVSDIGETSFDALSNDKYCICWTSEAKWRKKFREWYTEHKEECGKFIDEGEYKGAAVTLEIPKICLSYIRFPRTKEMSEEDKIKAAERMAKARKNKKINENEDNSEN